MKTIPIALQEDYLAGTTSFAYGLKVVRLDKKVFAFTSAPRDIWLDELNEFGGPIRTRYVASVGLSITNLQFTNTLAVDNLELTTLDDGTVFTKPDIFNNIWANAAFEINKVNWRAPDHGKDILMVGTIGEVEVRQNLVVAELRGLQQYFNQPIGAVTNKTCRARLGDSECTVDLAPITFEGSVTFVDDPVRKFTDASNMQLDDYFAEGIITFTSGACVGLQQKIRSFSTGGVFTLYLSMFQQLQIGDTYSAVAGCRKRMQEDCFAKFNNVLNFQGEPHLRGVDSLTSPP